jgi:hypothetical protein
MSRDSFGPSHESDDDYAARHVEQDAIDASYEELRLPAEQDLLDALRPFSDFADALNEAVPDNIAIGIYADGAMRFGPSGGATVGDLRKARAALAKLAARS